MHSGFRPDIDHIITLHHHFLIVFYHQNAVANIVRTGPQGALTGPAARGDTTAIARQSAAVAQWDPQAGAAYDALSTLALRMAKTNKDTIATNATAL